MSTRLYCKIDGDTEGKTLKHIMRIKLGLSSRLLKKLKYSRKILLNGVPSNVDIKVKNGDIAEALVENDDEGSSVIPQEIPISIIYEDECIVVVNKQPGIVVHPAPSHPAGTLANALAAHYLKKGISPRIRPVSRLDRDTSGLIVFAADQYSQEYAARQMRSGRFIKEYIGIVEGDIDNDSGTINLPIARKPGSIMQREISPAGSVSVTHYEILEHLHEAALVRFRLETGRTHQIRVHCQSAGHPLIGDTLYGSCSGCPSAYCGYIGRQALHSSRVSFDHPLSGARMSFSVPLPGDMESLLCQIRKFRLNRL